MNLYFMQCFKILGSFHAQYLTLDGTNADPGIAPNQDEEPPVTGNAGDNEMDDTITGGSAFS